MKEQILAMLRQQNEYISGQQMCEQLGVSRTAVWKMMNQLKEEGYVIEAVSNKGYVLKESPDTVTDYEINSMLRRNTLIDSVIAYDTIGSTNNIAKELACTHKENLLVVADTQSAGRGSKGRGWESPKGSGIWMSFLLHPSIEPYRASQITLVTALAVTKAIEEVSDLNPRIKWPNDIVLNKKKVCGILTEMSSEVDYIHYIVVGMGINVHTTDFPVDIRDTATSLSLEGGKIKRSTLIARIVEKLDEYYTRFLKAEDLSPFIEEYNQLLVHLDKEIKVLALDSVQHGIARGIGATGDLLLDLPDGTRKSIISGEVSVRGMHGYIE